MYGKLSPEFTTSSGVRHGCPLSPFLFNFVIDLPIESPLPVSDICGVGLPGCSFVDIEYADDVALLGSDPSKMQAILNEPNYSAALFGMRFTPPECKMHLQDWVGSNPNLLADEPISVVDHFNYLGSLISPGGLANKEATQRIAKASAAFANL